MNQPDDEKSSCPRWQRRPAERPREILDAARVEFAEAGFDKATVADVARRAGVSPATVAHYFGSKADLFEALIAEEALSDLAGDEQLLATHRGSYRELLQLLLSRMWTRLQRPGKPEMVLVVLGEMSAFPQSAQLLFRQLFERSRGTLKAVLEAGNREGEFDIPDPEAAAHLLASTVLGTTLDLHFIAPCFSIPRCRDRALPVLLEAVNRIVGPAGPART